MKRKLFLLITILTLILSLSSCSLLFGKASLDYTYDEARADEIRELMVEAEQYLASGNEYDKYYDAYIDINMFAYQIITYYQKENIKFAMNGNDESAIKMQEFYSLFMEIANWQTDILVDTYNSNYKDEFFKDWSEKEIQQIFDSNYPDEYYTLNTRAQELTTEYEKLDRAGAIEQAPAYLKELTAIRNQIANVTGYNDYSDFSYGNVYGRDYLVSDSVTFTNYVKKYIVPLTYKLADRLAELEQQLTDSEYLEIHIELFANAFDDRKHVDSFVKKIGNPFTYEYNYLTSRGHCYYSNDINAMQGAFTTYMYWDGIPAVYFGPGYQDSFTFVHEFGHYYSAARIDKITGSNDLAETQSQGNEMLFLAYLMQYSDFNDIQKEYLETRQLYEALCVIMISSIVNEFELKLYPYKDELKPEVIDALCIEVCQGYGGYEKILEKTQYNTLDYYKLVCVSNPCYYISYAISLIPSIGIYEMAMNDFNNAKDCYLDLCEVKDMDFLDALKTANLYNPFEEAVYIGISELLG